MEKIVTIIITGSNKGIGFGMVENLIQKQYRVIMACRNIQLADESREKLLIKYKNVDPSRLLVAELDISNPQSINNFVSSFVGKFKEADILVNNAGIAFKGDRFDEQVVKETFQTNFYGTVDLSEKFLSVINQNGKIITLGSRAGLSGQIKSQELKQRFLNPKLTRDQLFELANEFQVEVAHGSYQEKGWPRSGYGISKLLINSFTRILAQNPLVKDKNIQVYTCCPGYVNTDMTSGRGILTIEQGVITPIWLVELPNQLNVQYQGQFFAEQKIWQI